MKGYLIAIMRKPMPDFLKTLREVSAAEGVEIRGAVLTSGIGCYNLGFLLDGENEAYVNALTLALMPARWCTTEDPQLVAGEYKDEVN